MYGPKADHTPGAVELRLNNVVKNGTRENLTIPEDAPSKGGKNAGKLARLLKIFARVT